MKGRYKAAFVIPIGTMKVLGEDGWEFEGSGRISSRVKDCLLEALKLKFSETYLRIDKYVGSNIQMSVVRDVNDQMQSISFQMHGDALNALSEVFRVGELGNESELFIP